MKQGTPEASLDGVRIGILHHARSSLVRSGYLIAPISDRWKDRGARVIDIIGAGTPVPVDVLLCHVDLSVVPEEYRRFAQDHPRVINLSANDIRKSSYLDDLVGVDDPPSGPVIVKSDLNHGGLPERLLGSKRTGPGRIASGIMRRLRRRLNVADEIRFKSDYRIYPDRRSVPARRFTDGSVIQPFRPERRDGGYVLRECYFLGDVEILSTEVGSEAVMTTGRQVESRQASAPPEVRAVRDRLKLDYGKIDYGCPDGDVVVYDANKCVGTRRDPGEPTRQLAAALSAGIDAWLDPALSR
ncbi:MAG: hypothetical protein GY895_20110 [Phycisphaera sp.]|nr:hypothetical protein [Phycisphaera sp.]